MIRTRGKVIPLKVDGIKRRPASPTLRRVAKEQKHRRQRRECQSELRPWLLTEVPEQKVIDWQRRMNAGWHGPKPKFLAI